MQSYLNFIHVLCQNENGLTHKIQNHKTWKKKMLAGKIQGFTSWHSLDLSPNRCYFWWIMSYWYQGITMNKAPVSAKQMFSVVSESITFFCVLFFFLPRIYPIASLLVYILLTLFCWFYCHYCYLKWFSYFKIWHLKIKVKVLFENTKLLNACYFSRHRWTG